MTLLAGSLGAITAGVQACQDSVEETLRQIDVIRTGRDLMDRLTRLELGNDPAGSVTNAQLQELLDDDDDLGTGTLSSMRLGPADLGTPFELAWFPHPGNWTIRVTSDLNLDGDEADETEGRADVLRVDLYFDGSPLLSTIRVMD